MKCEWFAIDCADSFVEVTPRGGEWAEDIDPSKMSIPVGGSLQVEGEYTTLLDAEETPLIVRITNPNWPASQIIVVLNGSMLLNLPLVDHEHRKLAAALIDQCSDGRVTFLESGPGEIRVSDQDPRAYSGFEAFTVWPISSILLHLTIAGILFCVMVFPIFGKPRTISTDTTSDFGKHIRATGELLAQVNDRQAALRHIEHYHHLTSDSQSKTEGPDAGNPFQTSTEATRE
jgi:hypothetical protein